MGWFMTELRGRRSCLEGLSGAEVDDSGATPGSSRAISRRWSTHGAGLWRGIAGSWYSTSLEASRSYSTHEAGHA
jgi:hypothetical protein